MHRLWKNPVIKQSELKYLSNFRNINQMRFFNSREQSLK